MNYCWSCHRNHSTGRIDYIFANLLFKQKRRTGDGSMQTDNQITLENPLCNGEFEHDLFEFDFIEGMNP